MLNVFETVEHISFIELFGRWCRENGFPKSFCQTCAMCRHLGARRSTYSAPAPRKISLKTSEAKGQGAQFKTSEAKGTHDGRRYPIMLSKIVNHFFYDGRKWYLCGVEVKLAIKFNIKAFQNCRIGGRVR